ncbi:MAG: aldo/keto reductase [Armatimonadota bacterium]
MAIPMLRLKTGHDMPQLGLGTWQLRGQQCVEAVTAAIEMGYNHIDTADMYGNHREVGEALQQFDRSEIFVTSKVPPENLRHDDLIATCERNLQELRLDYLDLYLVHWPNPDIPMEETFAALAELVDRKFVRSVGVSNFTIALLDRGMEISGAPICVNQVEFHPMLYQKDLLDFCSDNDVLLTAYCPLARTQALQLDTIQALAEKYDRKPAQVCLRWLMQKDIIAIPKSKSPQRLDENMQIFDWVLSDEDEAAIDDIETHQRLVTAHWVDFPD